MYFRIFFVLTGSGFQTLSGSPIPKYGWSTSPGNCTSKSSYGTWDPETRASNSSFNSSWRNLHKLRRFPFPLLQATTYLPWNVRNASEEKHFVWKVTDVHDTLLFTLRIWKLVPREVALPHFSAICPWTFHYNVCPNKDYRKKIGPTKRSPRITVYILRLATRAISFKFILFVPQSINRFD